MKNYLLYWLLVCTIISAKAQTAEKTLNSKVTEVTVYMQGALLVETVNTQVSAGKQVLVFRNIPAGVDPAKIHVNVSNSNVKLLAVTHRLPGRFDASDDVQLRRYDDSLRAIQDEMEIVTASLNAYDEEKKLLLANKSIGGSQSGVSVNELQKAADFYRNRLADIDKQILKLRKRERKLNDEISRVTTFTDAQKAVFNASSSSIALTLNANERANTQIRLQYLVSVQTAGWAPAYEVKVKDISAPLQLNYRGRVFNNTGVNWEGVKLTLSTADPYQSAQRPDLQPWTLGYSSKYSSGRNKDKSYNEGYVNRSYTKDDASKQLKQGSKPNVQFSEVYVNELSVDFTIKEPSLIPSDAKPYAVDIQTYEMPASFRYYSVPKMDRDAFLVAGITGWETLNLIEGPVDIYYADNYTGQSYIDTRFANDTLELSLGRDKKVTVTRIKREDYTQKRLFGVNRTESYMYELAVRNNNSQPIDIEILDQVPVSQESDININIENISGAELEPLSGKLLWRMKIQPSQTDKKTIAFAVRYPKYRNVEVRKWRRINCPDF